MQPDPLSTPSPQDLSGFDHGASTSGQGDGDDGEGRRQRKSASGAGGKHGRKGSKGRSRGPQVPDEIPEVRSACQEVWAWDELQM